LKRKERGEGFCSIIDAVRDEKILKDWKENERKAGSIIFSSIPAKRLCVLLFVCSYEAGCNACR
jgi:hypothetical protein